MEGERRNKQKLKMNLFPHMSGKILDPKIAFCPKQTQMIKSGSGERNVFLISRIRTPTKAGRQKEEKNNWKDGRGAHADFAGHLGYARCIGVGAGLHSQPGLAPHRADGLSRDTWRAAGSPGSPPPACEPCHLSQKETHARIPTIGSSVSAQLLYHLAQKELMNAVVACEFIFLRWNRYVFGKDFALRLFTGEHLWSCWTDGR